MRHILLLMTVLAGSWVIPSSWCSRRADAWFEGQYEVRQPMADGLAAALEISRDPAEYGTGDPRFDSEWHFGTAMMAAMAFGQMAAGGDESQLANMELAIDQMLVSRRFDTDAWGTDVDDDPAGDHAAFLGYANLALSLHRRLGSDRYAPTNDRWSERLDLAMSSSDGLLETYPGERYPVDNCAVLSSIVLHAEATGAPRPKWVDPWLDQLSEDWIRDGVLIQSTSWSSAPRGSGSALASYFLSYASTPLSTTLAEGLKSQLHTSVAGFGALREYRRGEDGYGDIDSGPLILGYSISATGFALASARWTYDRRWFRQLFATAWLFGCPTIDESKFVTGGPLGNAILLAMMTR